MFKFIRKSRIRLKKLPCILIAVVLVIGSCGIYSYPCTSFNENYKVSIGNFKNNLQTFDPEMNYKIRQKLENKFRQDYKWRVVDKEAGLDIQGSIYDYFIKPISINSKSEATINRIFLTFSFQSINSYNDEEKKDEKITEFVDYNAKRNLSLVKDSLHDILTTRIAEQIYNRITNNW